MTDIYVGGDGKLHKVQGGADSVLPFSSNIFENAKEICLIACRVDWNAYCISYDLVNSWTRYYQMSSTNPCNTTMLTNTTSHSSGYSWNVNTVTSRTSGFKAKVYRNLSNGTFSLLNEVNVTSVGQTIVSINEGTDYMVIIVCT